MDRVDGSPSNGSFQTTEFEASASTWLGTNGHPRTRGRLQPPSLGVRTIARSCSRIGLDCRRRRAALRLGSRPKGQLHRAANSIRRLRMASTEPEGESRLGDIERGCRKPRSGGKAAEGWRVNWARVRASGCEEGRTRRRKALWTERTAALDGVAESGGPGLGSTERRRPRRESVRGDSSELERSPTRCGGLVPNRGSRQTAMAHQGSRSEKSGRGPVRRSTPGASAEGRLRNVTEADARRQTRAHSRARRWTRPAEGLPAAGALKSIPRRGSRIERSAGCS